MNHFSSSAFFRTAKMWKSLKAFVWHYVESHVLSAGAQGSFSGKMIGCYRLWIQTTLMWLSVEGLMYPFIINIILCFFLPMNVLIFIVHTDWTLAEFPPLNKYYGCPYWKIKIVISKQRTVMLKSWWVLDMKKMQN